MRRAAGVGRRVATAARWQNAAMTSAPILHPAASHEPGTSGVDPGLSARASSPRRLAFAATSARSLVECARASGIVPIALDVFGDLDTRRLADACVAVGGGGLAMDRDALLAALAGLRARGDVAGWVAGSGFEAQLGLLAEGALQLPLIGNRPETVRRVRSPAGFAALLDAQGIAHPDFSADPPADPRGWLVKDAHACGGWHVRPAEKMKACAPGEGRYFQRRVAGEPWSCLFLAAGDDVRVVGFSRQIVRALGQRPYVYRGGIGPVALPSAVRELLSATALKLTRALGLRGLNGIDFVLDAAGWPWVLELNPRPTAAIQLFADACEGGLMRAHVEACAGRLPVSGETSSPALVRGFETVFARRAGRIGEAAAAWLAGQAWCCDVPQPGTRHAWGDPLCTVRAQGESVEAVLRRLGERRRSVSLRLQPPMEDPSR